VASPHFRAAAERFNDLVASALPAVCDYLADVRGAEGDVVSLIRVDCVRCGRMMKAGPENWKGRPMVSICDDCATRAKRLDEEKRERRRRFASRLSPRPA
jgi:adenine-specific DNA methylase